MIDAGPAQERDNFIGITFIYLGDKQKGWDLLSKNMETNGCYLFLKCDPFILKYKNKQKKKSKSSNIIQTALC